VVTVAFVTMLVSGAEVDSVVAAWLIYGAATLVGLLYLIPPRQAP